MLFISSYVTDPHLHLFCAFKAKKLSSFLFAPLLSLGNLPLIAESEQTSIHGKPDGCLLQFSCKEWVFPGENSGTREV